MPSENSRLPEFIPSIVVPLQLGARGACRAYLRRLTLLLATSGLVWSTVIVVWAGIRLADHQRSTAQHVSSALILIAAAFATATLTYRLLLRSRRRHGTGRLNAAVALSGLLTTLLAGAVPLTAAMVGAAPTRSSAAFFLFCPWIPANGVQPEPSSAGELSFCQVDVNSGRRPINGEFVMSGRVIGPLNVRRNLILVSRADQRTCDALGNPPADGTFLMNVRTDSADGSWSVVETQGYPEAVTIGRTYEFMTASASSIAIIRDDRDQWAAEGNDPNDYPGVQNMPPDAVIIASFYIGPGQYRGTTPPCP